MPRGGAGLPLSTRHAVKCSGERTGPHERGAAATDDDPAPGSPDGGPGPRRATPGGDTARAAVRPDVRHRLRHRRERVRPHARREPCRRRVCWRFAVATFSVCWAWINFSWFASAYDTDDWIYRLMTMLQMVGVIIMALGFPPMFASIEHGEHVDNTRHGGRVCRDANCVGGAMVTRGQTRSRPPAGMPDLRPVGHRRADRLDRQPLPAHIAARDHGRARGAHRGGNAGPGAGRDASGRHAVARASHRRTVWPAGDHRARRRCGWHRGLVVGGGQRAGVDVRRRVRRSRGRRAHLRHVVVVFRGATGRASPRPSGSVLLVRLPADRDVRRDRGDRRGTARRRLLHRAPFEVGLGRNRAGRRAAGRALHRLHLRALHG